MSANAASRPRRPSCRLSRSSSSRSVSLPGDPASSRWSWVKSVCGELYFSSRATLVCFALARPRPMGEPPRAITERPNEQAAPICVCLLSCDHSTVPRRGALAGPAAANVTAHRVVAAQAVDGQPSRAGGIGRRQRIGVDRRRRPAFSPPVVSSVSAGRPRLSSASAIGPRSTWSTTVPSAADRAAAGEHGVAGRRAVGRAVEVQQHQHPRRSAQVVHPRDGLLPAVAALVQVDGALARAADPADLVRDGPLVGVDAQPRPQRRHPVCLVGPYPGGAHAGGGQPVDASRRRRRGAPRRRVRHRRRVRPACGARIHRREGRSRPARRAARSGPGPSARARRQAAGRSTTAPRGPPARRRHLRPEHHPAQIGQQRLAAPRFGVEIRRRRRVRSGSSGPRPGPGRRGSDSALLVPSGSSRRVAWRWLCSQLCRSGPVSVQHPAVRAVDDDGFGGRGPLLTQRIAVMPHGAGVGSGLGGGYS